MIPIGCPERHYHLTQDPASARLARFLLDRQDYRFRHDRGWNYHMSKRDIEHPQAAYRTMAAYAAPGTERLELRAKGEVRGPEWELVRSLDARFRPTAVVCFALRRAVATCSKRVNPFLMLR